MMRLSKKSQISSLARLKSSSEYLYVGGIMVCFIGTLAISWVFLQTSYLGDGYFLRPLKLALPVGMLSPEYPGLPQFNYILNNQNAVHRRFPKINDDAINTSIEFAKMVMTRLDDYERVQIHGGITVPKNSPMHNQYLHSYPDTEALGKSIDAFVALKASSFLVHNNCQRFGFSDDECAHFISTMSLESTILGPKCILNQDAHCDSNSKYRTIDGTCNNLENPKHGSAQTAYARLEFPHYSDGIQQPRNVRTGGIFMPNPRVVSVSLTSGNNREDEGSHTLAMAEWSQFVAHDIAHTPVRNMIASGQPISCCRSDGEMPAPRNEHPNCAAISVPDKDPVYGKDRIRCINYVRSLPVVRQDCHFGPVEQMNQASHFLDGSTIYGSTFSKAQKLRTFESGKLRTEKRNNHEYLPSADSKPASLCYSNECYESGDDRANVEPHLTVLHTIWHREHNRIAEKLSKLNPHWDDETLYQEARRIVIAEIQHVTYNEWLPILIGKDYAELAMEDSSYDPTENPAVSNEAATAAMRFLNSLKQSELSLPDESREMNDSLKLSEYFYKPKKIESDSIFDGLLRGLTTQSTRKMDLNVVDDMTTKLYKTNGKLGLDVVSLDIQRGRDHGLPGYNKYRHFCNLTLAETFNDFLDHIPRETVKKLSMLYSSPEDVDLVIGGMAEKPENNSLLGPTFRCLIAEQFSRSRRTDRFFYDSFGRKQSFTPEQLSAIKKVTFARIFCDNGNNLLQMQKNVFAKPGSGNNLVRCSDQKTIPSLNLLTWVEENASV